MILLIIIPSYLYILKINTFRWCVLNIFPYICNMKRNIIILSILLSNFFGYTQSINLDSIEKDLTNSIFNRINDYRIFNDLNVLYENIEITKFSESHNDVLMDSDKLVHSKEKYYSECVFLYKIDNFAAKDTFDAINYALSNNIDIIIFDGWVNSKAHNDILLNDSREGGLDIKIKTIKGKSTFPKGSNVYTVIFYATYNVL